MIKRNFHTHTRFSDGQLEAVDYVVQAINEGMEALGFTDHSPLPFDNPFSLKTSDIPVYISTIRSLQSAYAGQIEIYMGLEMDYVPDMSEPFDQLSKKMGLDYVIGSVHLVGKSSQEALWFTDGPDRDVYDAGLRQFFGGNIQKAVGAFFSQTNEMIVNETFDVIGHFDKIKMHNQGRYFSESDHWYRNHIFETLHLIKEKGLIAEVNTRGIYKKRCDSLYPSGWILREMNKMGIPVLISSDAHHPGELQEEFVRAAEVVQAAGYTHQMAFRNGKWLEVAMNYPH